MTLCAVPLASGEKAPFAGQLLSTDLALKLGQAAELCDQETAIATRRILQDSAIDLWKAQIDCKAKTDAFQAELAKANAEAARAQKLAEEEAPPWYAQPWFVAPTAAIIAASAVVFVFKH